ncbi:hypothetical protein C8R43DRAFT_1051632 [Mycena crocata]|nr:hypothetical protein C8R43DRAFT_1051632 [Mycena crocata]
MQLTPLRIRLAEVSAQLTQLSSPWQGSVETRIALHEKRAGLTEEEIRLQDSINSFTYPILTLPPEITSEFFVCCLPDTPTLPDEAIAPMLLTRICRQWRQIALNEPRLWASLKIDSRTRVLRIVQDWLPRARSVPQTHSVAVEGFGWDWSDYDPDEEAEYEEDERPPFSEGRREHYFVRFWEHLTSFIGKRFSVDGVLELLRHVPRLIHCDLIEVYVSDSPSVVHHTPLLHMHLKSLIFRGDEKSNLNHDRWSARSGTTNDEILRVLPKIPSLMNLRLDTDDGNIVFGLIYKLLDTHFLPRIEKLTLVERGWNEDFFWDEEDCIDIIDALDLRSEATPDVAQLLEFTIFIDADVIDSRVSSEMDDALQELREEGMKIYIGPEKRLH